jgi:hypothetical protein
MKYLAHRLNCLTWGSFSFLFLGWYIILRLGTFNLDNIIASLKMQSLGRPTRSTTEGNFEELAERTTSSPEMLLFGTRWLLIVQVEGVLYTFVRLFQKDAGESTGRAAYFRVKAPAVSFGGPG